MSATDCKTVFGDNLGDRIDLFYQPTSSSGGPVVELVVDGRDQPDLTVTLGAYHLRELRLALQQAERWVASNGRPPS